jgi:DNA invertase Pin-like site-specific DNA recombinase
MAILSPRLKALKPSIRRLASQGLSADAIARLYQISRADVRTILATPLRPLPPTGRDRRILGLIGTKVRRLHFEEGQDAAAIAEALDLDPYRVADFLDRLTPRQNHHRRRGVTINRPRSAREQAALHDWTPNRISDEDGAPLDMPVPELVAPELVAPELVVQGESSTPIIGPTLWDGGPISPMVGKIDGTPVRRGPAKRRNARASDDDGRVKLDSEKRRQLRRLAKQGWGIRRLARHFGVSPHAIRDVLRGPRATTPVPARQTPQIGRLEPRSEPGTCTAKTKPRGRAKLTSEQRDEIRRLAGEGWGCRRLAQRFGVEDTAILRLLKGVTFKNDRQAPPPPPIKPRPTRWREPKRAGINAKLTYQDAEEVRRLRREGWTRAELATLKGVSLATIGNILARRTYTAPPLPC